MKPTTRDYLTVAAAFLAVFFSGYGVGHVVCERRNPPPAPHHQAGESLAWQRQTIAMMTEALELRPQQIPAVEAELSKTASDIRGSHDAVLLQYHRHILDLYERLIPLLDEAQQAKLQAEKTQIEKQIDKLGK